VCIGAIGGVAVQLLSLSSCSVGLYLRLIACAVCVIVRTYVYVCADVSYVPGQSIDSPEIMVQLLEIAEMEVR